MVFEQFLESKKIKKHFLYLLLLGLFYVLVSHIISDVFFPEEEASLVIIFITTMFLIPSTYVLLNNEEAIDAKCEGIKCFFKNHKFMMKIYFALFIGIFIGFTLVNIYAADSPMEYQKKVLRYNGDINEDLSIDINQENANWGSVMSFVGYNTAIIIVAFFLSVFYGAGALFLLILNASIFSAYITILFQNFNSLKIIFASAHMIPELFGFFLAALAGGIISRALFKEKFMSDEFRNVVKDAIFLLLLSFLVIVVAAILEVFVVINFFHLFI